MRHKNLRIISCLVLTAGTLSGLSGCSSMPSKSIQTETIAPNVDDTTAGLDMTGQNQESEEAFETESQNAETESNDIGEDHIDPDEAELANAAKFGNPKEVLDHIAITSNVEVQKTADEEFVIEFELKNVGHCTFAVHKGEEFTLPNEVFVDSTKIEWTAPTADGEYIFPDMRVNEAGDLFMIDWAYNGYCFAIYGESPQNTSDRDMAGKVALEIIRNLGGAA